MLTSSFRSSQPLSKVLFSQDFFHKLLIRYVCFPQSNVIKMLESAGIPNLIYGSTIAETMKMIGLYFLWPILYNLDESTFIRRGARCDF